MTQTHPDRLAEVLRFAACPGCRGPLRRGPGAVGCEPCGRSYPLVAGRPVFLPDPGAVRVVSPTHLSNQPPPWVTRWLRDLDGWALNVGAGGTAEKIPNVIELEYALFHNTDVSADAHRLPFRDACFDAVVTFNTFEHLADPPRAAREILRVLKPGGRLLLHTAFLQPVHEPPFHFYNATEYGVRKWFEGFDVRDCRVTDNFHPGYTLAWLTCEVLDAVSRHLGPDARDRLAAVTLAECARGWTDHAFRPAALWDAVRQLPPAVQARFAAGFELDAVKPTAPGEPPVAGEEPAGGRWHRRAAELWDECQVRQRRVGHLEAEVRVRDEKVAGLREEVGRLAGELQAVRASRRWRYATGIRNAVRGLLPRRVRGLVRRLLRPRVA
jgi:SAM-dependent methyltransferase